MASISAASAALSVASAAGGAVAPWRGMVRLLGGDRDLRPVHGDPARAGQAGGGRDELATRGDWLVHGSLRIRPESHPISAP
jgi:hypothetical protein